MKKIKSEIDKLLTGASVLSGFLFTVLMFAILPAVLAFGIVFAVIVGEFWLAALLVVAAFLILSYYLGSLE